MAKTVSRLPELANPLFEMILAFRTKLRKGFDVTQAEVRRDLLEIFNDLDVEARRDARLDLVYREKGKYILAAFVDDVIINSDEWKFAYDWKHLLLEHEFFKTSVAGEKIPEYIRQVTGSEEEAGLGELLFIILALGYRGKYKEGTGELEAFRQRLYQLLPDRMSREEIRLTPGAYENLELRQAKRLRPLYTFLRVCVVSTMAVVLMLVTIIFVLKRSSGEISNAFEEILKNYVP